MKRVIAFLVLGFFLVPNLSFAATGSCSKDGYTVITMNGIFTKDEEAKKIKKH